MNERASHGVTLVMPMYNEAADIDDVLTSLSEQSYPHDAIYLVVVDGGSTDGSTELVESWLAHGDISGEVVTNRLRTIPRSMNLGLERARPNDILIRLDAHTTYAPDYVAMIVSAFESASPDVGCVGGPVMPAPERDLNRALVAALYTNPMGLGGADFRHGSEPRIVRAAYLGAWRPGVLEAAGGYDERWEANEDGELAARVRDRGYRTLWIPLRSAYRVKRGALAAVKQWGRYGYWRAQTVRRHPGELRIRHLVPPAGLIASALLLATPLRPLVALLYVAYVLTIVAKSVPGERRGGTLASCVFFPACQIAWTLGLLRGLLAPSFSARGAASKQPQPDSIAAH